MSNLIHPNQVTLERVDGIPHDGVAGSENSPTELALRVTRTRERLGLSREEFAHRTGMNIGYLANFERNPRALVSGGLLLRIAKALETSPAELLNRSPVFQIIDADNDVGALGSSDNPGEGDCDAVGGGRTLVQGRSGELGLVTRCAVNVALLARVSGLFPD